MTAEIGHNGPPEETSPFDAHAVHITDLFDEARHFCDGDPCDSQQLADKAQQLMRMLQEAGKAADAQRVKDNEPFDEGKRAVQARYAPLIADTKTVVGKVPMAIAALKKFQQPWLVKLENERQAKIAADRAEANRLAEIAAKAAREAAQADNLQAQEEAEVKIAEARKAEAAAKRTETTTAKTSGGYGRASSLRDNFVPYLKDSQEAAKHFWRRNPEAFDALLLQLAKQAVAGGQREIPGFEVRNEPIVV